MENYDLSLFWTGGSLAFLKDARPQTLFYLKKPPSTGLLFYVGLWSAFSIEFIYKIYKLYGIEWEKLCSQGLGMEIFPKKVVTLNYDTNGVFSLDNLQKILMMDCPFKWWL